MSRAIVVSLVVASCFCAATAAAVNPPPKPLHKVGDHWTPYEPPTEFPPDAEVYIIQPGDTLWDLAQKFLGNPYLWPQLWEQNTYIRDAHWIYPGDPLVLPKVALVSTEAGAPTGADTGTAEDGEGEEGTGGTGQGAGETASVLYPASEDAAIQCAHYIAPGREDESLYALGSELGGDKVALSERDFLYLNRGSNGGVKAGDVYSLHRAAYTVRHPVTGKKLGLKIETSGWGRVILVSETSATLVVEQACATIYAGDYAKPFEKINVPLALRRPAADRLTPPSGKASGYVVDIAENADIAGTNSVVTIDLGSQAGLTPGNLLSVYRVMYPSQPTPRNVVGELAVLTVRETTATARVVSSRDAITAGDQVELR